MSAELVMWTWWLSGTRDCMFSVCSLKTFYRISHAWLCWFFPPSPFSSFLHEMLYCASSILSLSSNGCSSFSFKLVSTSWWAEQWERTLLTACLLRVSSRRLWWLHLRLHIFHSSSVMTKCTVSGFSGLVKCMAYHALSLTCLSISENTTQYCALNL